MKYIKNALYYKTGNQIIIARIVRADLNLEEQTI